MYTVMKQVGRKHKVVANFDELDVARKFVSKIVDENVVPACKAGRNWYLVNIWDMNKSSVRLLQKGVSNGSQKTLYNPASESKYFINFSAKTIEKFNSTVVKFPTFTEVSDTESPVDPVMTDSFRKVA
jgi:hypothetical protein